MSYHVFFDFSSGLTKPLRVPKGTLAAIMAHVAEVEKTLGLKRTRYRDNPAHWDTFDLEYRAGFPSVDDETLCETVEEHNNWVRRLYGDMVEWHNFPVNDGERITPEDAQEFWHALQRLSVPPNRWTEGYYRTRMEYAYEVMRGRECEGATFDEKALTPKQAAAVIRLFAQWLDPGDLRLDVPKGCDYLASSYDGGYVYCEKCGPITPEDAEVCRRRGCPIRKEMDREEMR